MSIIRYWPPIGTAGLDRCCVNGNSRCPCPPPRTSATTSLFTTSVPCQRASYTGCSLQRSSLVSKRGAACLILVPGRRLLDLCARLVQLPLRQLHDRAQSQVVTL